MFDYEINHETSKGTVRIGFDISDLEILILYRNSKIGSFESAFLDEDCERILIKNMEIDSQFRGLGIGRECIRLYGKHFEVYCGSSNNLDQQDSSRLVEDGPGFMEKMHKERLVKYLHNKYESYNDDSTNSAKIVKPDVHEKPKKSSLEDIMTFSN